MNSTSNEILPVGYKMTELGVFPEEWEVVRLEEVAENVKQKDPRRDPIRKSQEKCQPYEAEKVFSRLLLNSLFQ